MVIDINEIIEEHVKRCDCFSSDGRTYIPRLNEMNKTKLDTISQKDVEDIVRPFLYEWGRMGRILGRTEFSNWPRGTATVIQKNSQELEQFKKCDLSDTRLNLKTHKPVIMQLYSSFNKVVGQVAATKVLHLICPHFFPPWDNDIAAAVRSEIREKKPVTGNIDNFSPEDYYRFIQEIRTLLIKHSDLISRLANKYGKSKVRILDECFWWSTHRPLSLFF